MSRRKQGFIVDRRIRCGGTSQRNEENRDHVKKKIKCVAVSGRLAGCRGIISCEREITMTKPKLAALKRAALSSTACTSETQVSSFMRARARAHTTTLLYGDRPPNCRWRPLQICPLDRPVCLPLTLSFTLSLSSFSLSLFLSYFAKSSLRTENCYVVAENTIHLLPLRYKQPSSWIPCVTEAKEVMQPLLWCPWRIFCVLGIVKKLRNSGNDDRRSRELEANLVGKFVTGKSSFRYLQSEAYTIEVNSINLIKMKLLIFEELKKETRDRGWISLA